MTYLLNTVRNLFASNGQRTTQEWIRLQFFDRSNNKNLTTSDLGGDNGDIPESGLQPTRWGAHSSTLRYSLARFLKFIGKSWDARFLGWRGGIAGFTILATTVLLINISALIWTATHLDDGPFAKMAMKSCKSIANLSFWVHLGINVFSAGLLAGSNYCMQCLSSPTRDEVDTAHARCSYLNIGIFSWRNMVFFRKRRILLLLALALSSLPLHFVYSSSVCISGAVQMYDLVLVTPEFFSGGAWTQHGVIPHSYGQRYEARLRTLQDLAANGQAWNKTRWANLSAVECKDYKFYESDRGSVLLVMEGDQIQLAMERTHSFGSSSGRTSDIDEPGTVLWHNINLEWNPDAWQPDFLDEQPSLISYCLSLRVPGRCRIQIHLWFLLAVAVLNSVKLACFLLTYKEQRNTPLMIVGDAVASFLESTYARSDGMCLLSEDELISVLKKRRDDEDDDAGGQAKKFRDGHLRYYHSVSFLRWTIYATSCMFVILTSIYLYNEIMIKYRGERIQRNLRTLWKMGFGNLYVNSSGFLPPPWCEFYEPGIKKFHCYRAEYFHMMLGSLPQLIISAIYLALNYQLTAMIQLRDWARLAFRRQPLRVSDPEPASDQVSTYWLSLPYQYSIPLFISSVILGWLVSQAFFFYRFTLYDNDGNVFKVLTPETPTASPNWHVEVVHGFGYSALGVICSIMFGVTVFGVSLALGLQKCAPGLPLGPTNSLIIAAACHPPENDRHAARKPIMWGAIPTGSDAGEIPLAQHCTITSRRVEGPVEGRWYA